MRLLSLISVQSLDKNPLFVFLFVILARSFFTTPTFRIRASLLVLTVIAVRGLFLATSMHVSETLFRWGAIRSTPLDTFEPRPWPSDEPVLEEGISKSLRVFLAVIEANIARWGRKKRFRSDLLPLYVYTAELKGNNFPPALSSFPSAMGSSTVVVYHTPSECRENPYARFLLYHELGHLGLPSVRNRIANLCDSLLMISILAWNLSRGPHFWWLLLPSVIPVFIVLANPLAREIHADTYASERVYAILGRNGLDAVISAFERRCSNIADLISRTGYEKTEPRVRRLLVELKFRLSNLLRQRDCLEESGSLALSYDPARVVLNCLPIVAAGTLATVSVWSLPIGVAMCALLLLANYVSMGFLLGSLAALEFHLWDSGPYREAAYSTSTTTHSVHPQSSRSSQISSGE